MASTNNTFGSGPFNDVPVPNACSYCKEPKITIAFLVFPPFNDRYAVTTTGCVWSFERRIYLSSESTHEYARVLLCRKPCRRHPVVHKLVASTFWKSIPDWNDGVPDWTKYEVDHRDKNKKHNCVTNFAIVPKGQVKLGYQKGERRSKLADHVEDIRALLACGTPVKHIANLYQVSHSAIYDIRRGITHS